MRAVGARRWQHSCSAMSRPEPFSPSVAVVGAGAAGLIAARELRNRGLRPVVLEQSSGVGGIWRDSEASPLYANLRTNLPREVMGLDDFPFDSSFPKAQDLRRFPHHSEVLRYLQAFADAHDLTKLIRFNTSVLRASPSNSGGGWDVTTANSDQEQSLTRYDAVVVANGHYSTPRIPDIQGADHFPGEIMHSKSYTRPDAYRGKNVLILGASASGSDIADELATAGAQRVFLCAREHAPLGEGRGRMPSPGQAMRAPTLRELQPDGSAVLADGTIIRAVDVVILATGYQYDFPFLDGLVTVSDNRVCGLYKSIFPPAFPTLAFVGLPWKVVPFPQFQLQARWIAQVLSGEVQLPPVEDMQRDVEDSYNKMESSGTPVRYTHRLGDSQWSYNAWLAAQCGDPECAPWRRALYEATGRSRQLNGARYRDVELPGAEHADRMAREAAAAAWQAHAAAAASSA